MASCKYDPSTVNQTLARSVLDLFAIETKWSTHPKPDTPYNLLSSTNLDIFSDCHPHLVVLNCHLVNDYISHIKSWLCEVQRFNAKLVGSIPTPLKIYKHLYSSSRIMKLPINLEKRIQSYSSHHQADEFSYFFHSFRRSQLHPQLHIRPPGSTGIHSDPLVSLLAASSQVVEGSPSLCLPRNQRSAWMNR